ncbi:MAG TPA: TOPRIM nucleotidyl transferase/hydrolase domain-containing protein [Acidimicrobiales bacterium]|nr:TOPRIM nucleotidyl transferase/hydrolase domain-containing protein [Acidimicrobiales bacterium]
MSTVVLVEGASDKCAVETLARRSDRDLRDEGVEVLSMGGATNIGHFVRRFEPVADLAGLYDAGEEAFFRRALGDDLAARGFFVCVVDLEDELIRALGADRVERVIAAQGEIDSFRRFQKQPAHRGEQVEAQLRRFMGTTSGRKLHYARVLVEALELEEAPTPLVRLLARVAATGRPNLADRG